LTVRRAALFCVLFLLSSADAQAATRYIAPAGDDTAACTQAAPCQSFDRAYGVAGSGDVVEVAGGVYGSQSVPEGVKAVTFHGAPGNKVRSISNAASNVTFDGIDADAGGQKLVAFYNGGAANVTFKHGSIGNVVDEKGALVDGENMVYDDVVFHDVYLQTDGVHTECMFVSVPEGLVIRNSVFRNCAVMDVNMLWPGYWSPQPPAYGHVTLENNVFGRSTGAYGLMIAHTGPNAGAPACAQGPAAAVYLQGWRVVNNTFESAVLIGDGSNGCGDGTNVWANNIGGGWNCMSGVTFAGNVGEKCAAADKDATLSGGWFVDAAHDDLHLSATAPAINAASAAPATVTDRDGKYRDSQPDAGAYEYGAGGGPGSLARGTTPAPGAVGGGTASGAGGASAGARPAIASARLRAAILCRHARRRCPASTRLSLRAAGATRASVRLERVRRGHRARALRTWTFAVSRTTLIRARGLARGRYRLAVVAIGPNGRRSRATYVRFGVR
jgi:hypothetical protein